MRIRAAFPALIAVALTSLWLQAQVRDFRPVTEAMLRNPSPGDWLNWRRTDNAWGYSPLDQINGRTSGSCSSRGRGRWTTRARSEATPLVHDGIMYLPNPRGVIQALDAATGDLIWEYRPGPAAAAAQRGAVRGGARQTDIPRLSQRPVPRQPAAATTERGIQRNIAIFGDRIFGTTNDAHIIALDARTGQVVWDTTVADEAGLRIHVRPDRRPRQGHRGHRPDAADTRTTSASSPGTTPIRARRCGAPPPSPARASPAATRGAICRCKFRAGSDSWIPGSYDPEANLVYWGTAQAKPWAAPFAAPMAPRSTRTPRSRSIPIPER